MDKTEHKISSAFPPFLEKWSFSSWVSYINPASKINLRELLVL